MYATREAYNAYQAGHRRAARRCWCGHLKLREHATDDGGRCFKCHCATETDERAALLKEEVDVLEARVVDTSALLETLQTMLMTKRKQLAEITS